MLLKCTISNFGVPIKYLSAVILHKTMKKRAYLPAVFIVVMSLISCSDSDVYTGEEKPKAYSDFNYSTVSPGVQLDLAYEHTGVEAKVYFELYDQNPVNETEYTYVKREGVKPLFTAYTDVKGQYKGNVKLPAYAQKVWIYAPGFYARTLIEAEVKGGSIKATDAENSVMTRVVTATDKPFYCLYDPDAPSRPNEYKDFDWKRWLGEYDIYRNGEIQYLCTNDELKIQNSGELYTAHAQVLNISETCPEQYRSYTDLYVNEPAEVAVTFLAQNTCWNCSMGYYYYKDGQKPNSLKEAEVIMLFPNTQDGLWEKSVGEAKKCAGIERGTCVQLMYYPHIAEGSMEGATTAFPADTRIGFVLANNAWGNRIGRFNSHKRYRAATSAGLSQNNSGVVYQTPRTAAYRYGDQVMISFEDHIDDENFSDVVITMKSNPIKAITNVPVVDDEKGTVSTLELRGIYAFEDLWPSKGDYDMNDVVVRYDHEKIFNRRGQLVGESFIFKTFENFAASTNGLAFKLKPVAAGTTQCAVRTGSSSEFEPAVFDYEQGEKVYLLTDNVAKSIGTEFKVTLNYDSPITSGESEVDPFIFRNEANGKRWEVHLPQQAPTSKMDSSYFGTHDDASRPSQNLYYVRSGNYPFAFYLAGANENDIAPMLLRSNESKPVDQLFNGYKAWVESNGTTNTDWYKR